MRGSLAVLAKLCSRVSRPLPVCPRFHEFVAVAVESRQSDAASALPLTGCQRDSASLTRAAAVVSSCSASEATTASTAELRPRSSRLMYVGFTSHRAACTSWARPRAARPGSAQTIDELGNDDAALVRSVASLAVGAADELFGGLQREPLWSRPRLTTRACILSRLVRQAPTQGGFGGNPSRNGLVTTGGGQSLLHCRRAADSILPLWPTTLACSTS